MYRRLVRKINFNKTVELDDVEVAWNKNSRTQEEYNNYKIVRNVVNKKTRELKSVYWDLLWQGWNMIFTEPRNIRGGS